MGEDLSGLSEIRTDRVTRAVQKGRERERGKKRFGSHMQSDEDTREEEARERDAALPGQEADAPQLPHRPVRRGKLNDYEA